ncbi:hypothetical protein AUK18_00275 [Candidatus Beckwithbacteria bacterium CG2_30_44_31]|uniref:Uncharacterized protein n=1 Tax=Candidatus Beckwithbacteria bacterium CG2_30_44_31 TaxID=1805035 RepID=A0A1J5BBM9_9BACT|nr:MAG: hypothetical protein AUK18_00275 [Candidatus Beckwithbacteria bacterium CG2_30_44_31]
MKTNHFLKLPNRNLDFDTSSTFEQWSKTHQTHSAFIFDTKNVKVYYAQGNPTKVPFKEFGFT